jgi:hypothetical protein
MAWRCSGNLNNLFLKCTCTSADVNIGTTNAALIDNLASANIITKQRVIAAMKAIDRQVELLAIMKYIYIYILTTMRL